MLHAPWLIYLQTAVFAIATILMPVRLRDITENMDTGDLT